MRKVFSVDHKKIQSEYETRNCPLKRKENRIEAKVKPNEMVAFLSSVKQQESKLENNKTQPAPKGLVNLFQTKKLNSQNIGNLI